METKGVFELTVEADVKDRDPILETDFTVVFTRPDGSAVTAEGFYDGRKTYRGRAYADTPGEWQWHTQSNLSDLNEKTGRFTVFASNLNWCVCNDREIVPTDTELSGRMVHGAMIDRIAKDMAR